MATGAFWNLDNPAKPWGLFDPNSTLKFPIDIAAWLSDLVSTYASHVVLAPSPLESTASVRSGTFHRDRRNRASGRAITLPTSKPSPVSRKGGMCASWTPSGASAPQRAMAARANKSAFMRARIQDDCMPLRARTAQAQAQPTRRAIDFLYR